MNLGSKKGMRLIAFELLSFRCSSEILYLCSFQKKNLNASLLSKMDLYFFFLFAGRKASHQTTEKEEEEGTARRENQDNYPFVCLEILATIKLGVLKNSLKLK